MNLIKWITNKFSRKPLLAQPAVNSSCSKVIVWGHPLFDVKSGKDIDYHVNTIYIKNDGSDKVHVTFEQHGTLKIHAIEITMEHAQEIGFINLAALSNYC